VRTVADAFNGLRPSTRLHVWLNSDFRKRHEKWAGEYYNAKETDAVSFRSYEEMPGIQKINRQGDRSTLPEIDVIRRCVKADGSRVCYLGYLDGQLINLALGRYHSLNAKLVGVMDQPYLHYYKLYGRKRPACLTRGMQLKGLILNFCAVHRAATGRVLMGDPLGPEFYRRTFRSDKYHFLPEPFSRTPPTIDPRKTLGLPKDRRLLLFIGGTEKRKGICEMLSALDIVLRGHARLRTEIAFVLAGRVISETKNEIATSIAGLRSSFPDISISVHDRFLTDQEYVDFIAAADLICIPYINTIGTSGVLAHAASAARPVLSTDFGITGELVRRYRLGITCDPTESGALQKGILEALSLSRENTFDRETGRLEFLRNCTVPSEELGERIVRHLTEVANEAREYGKR
jgi:glycosyltransferase involved in cell wall biosynthesis